jgi:hypothetical protein
MSTIYQVFQGPTWRGDATTMRRAQQIVDECVARGCHPNFLRIETKDDGFGDKTDPYKNGFWEE